MYRFAPLILVFIAVLSSPYLPLPVQETFLALSLTIRSLIVFILPLIIGGLLFRTIVNLAGKATYIIGIIFVCVCCSNFINTMLSHFVGQWIYGFEMSMTNPAENALNLQPLWHFELPKLIPNNWALFSGIVLGFLGTFFWKKKSISAANFIEKIITYILKIVIYLVPFFILGYLVKLRHDQLISGIFQEYAQILGVIVAVQISYIIFVYFILSKASFKNFFNHLKNMMPAAICGFSTMSSAASMPLAIIGVEKNTSNKDLAKSVIPATVSIHLVGDCFAIPILAYAVLKNYGVSAPDMTSYLIFAFYFVITKFSVPAIPAGGIITMIPILESYLGFNSSMSTLITALYMLFDPIITCTNILGNGAFAKFIDYLVKTPSKA